MPITLGKTVKSVADVVQVLTKCTDDEANEAEKKICATEKGRSTIALACGLEPAMISISGFFLSAGLTIKSTEFVAVSTIAFGAGMKARKYCEAMVKYGVAPEAASDEQQDSLP
jgi:hypothetical protein